MWAGKFGKEPGCESENASKHVDGVDAPIKAPLDVHGDQGWRGICKYLNPSWWMHQEKIDAQPVFLPGVGEQETWRETWVSARACGRKPGGNLAPPSL